MALSIGISSAYLYEKKKSREYTVYISSQFHPYVTGDINGLKGNFILDTGGTFFCKLDKGLVENLPRSHFLKKVNLFDFKGVIDEFDVRYFEKIKFLDVNIRNFSFIENLNSEKGVGKTTFDIEEFFVADPSPNQEPITSFIGHKFLAGTNFFLDLKSKKMKLYKAGLVPFFDFPYRLSKKIPLFYNPSLGLICEIKTPFGNKNMLIDTGAPISILKNDPCFQSFVIKKEPASLNKLLVSHFSIGSQSFENQPFFIEPGFNIEGIDGILGLDFFKDKKLFIHWKDQYMCLQNN
jgi:hypothetical protein